jgi:hypothetical protein
MLKISELKENFEYPDAKIVEFKGKEIFVKQYLPVVDKYGLLYTAIAPLELGRKPYHPIVAEILFDLEVIKYYSSIEFDEEESYFKIFDILQINGIIDLIIQQIPIDEYEEIQRLYKEMIEQTLSFNGNFANGLQTLLNNLPQFTEEFGNLDMETLEKGKEIVEKLTKENHI